MEQRIGIISDLHVPNEHPDALDFVKAVGEEYGINEWVSVGDEFDGNSISYHEKDPRLPSPKDEFERARDTLNEWFTAFPELTICESNHGGLWKRKLKTAGLYLGENLSYNSIWGIPKSWCWVPSHRIRLECGVLLGIQHSIGAAEATVQRKLRGICLAGGHHHNRMFTTWVSTPDYLLWGMNVGCLIDYHSPAFDYAKPGSENTDRPLLGMGVVVDGCPMNIPMWLDDGGRWKGVLP